MLRPAPFVLAALVCASMPAAWADDAAPKSSEPARPVPAASPIQFDAHRLGALRSESICVGDINGDGKLDVIAGPFVYLAPNWQPLKVRALSGEVGADGKGYVDDFANLAIDVDGDGRLDIVSAGWFGKCLRWAKNTPDASGLWPEVIAAENGNFETAHAADLDNDGKANEILSDTAEVAWYEPGKAADGSPILIKHRIAEGPSPFGAGAGDINGDGRNDLLRPDAWFEAPTDVRKGEWKRHPWALGAPDGKADHTPQILVHDINGDGRADVITSSAHKNGIFWYEQGAEGSWTQHTIDASWSQAHSLALADIDGDGTPDLVTGKRFMAHNGSDPDEFGPLGIYWYKLTKGVKPTWTKYAISYDQGIGSGVSLVATDLDGDGDSDVVVTGKWAGPVWFENRGPSK